MKNKKLIELIENGLTLESAKTLTESEINILYKKIIGEAVTKNVQMTTYSPSETKGKTFKGAVSVNPDNSITVAKEGEIGESKSKKKKQDPFAICTAQLGKEFGTTKRSMWSTKETNKYERCVKDVKKSLKEGKNPVSLFLENEIMRLVERHIPPRITKGDLLQYLSEDTETAPSKPKTKPTTKPGTKPKPKSPGHNPNPGEKEAPRANTTTAPTKPVTKPTTKPRPMSPGQNPNPGEKEAPRAISPERAKTEVINAIMKILDNE